MHKAEFDQFAEEYYQLHHANIRVSGESPDFFAEYKVHDVYQLAAGTSKEITKIMDFGSGVGNSIPYFIKYFPNAELNCIDVSEKSLAVAEARFGKGIHLKVFDGKRLPIPDNTLDLAFAACVFHHIPHEEHITLLTEWHRVLKPGGLAIVFEHNPLNPLTRHAVDTCPFDVNAKLIHSSIMQHNLKASGFTKVNNRYRLFIPGVFRALRPIERWLYWCPLGAQYLTFAFKPDQGEKS
jgi:ubiquinone/menaquinone biosynthesis C-methylase UbiE